MDKTPPTIGDVFAERVHELRQARGWSVARLAEECAAIGAPEMSTHALVNLSRKTGRRKVAIEEWLILASALRVSPMALLVPPQEAEVRVTADEVWSTDALLGWMRSTTPECLPFDPIQPVDSNDHVALKVSGTLRLLDAHRTLVALIVKYRSESDEETARRYVKTLRTYRRHIRERGETPPTLPPEIAELVGPDGDGIAMVSLGGLTATAVGHFTDGDLAMPDTPPLSPGVSDG